MSHNGIPPCHDNAYLKSIENSGATMTQPAKNFHAKDSVFLREMHLLWFYFDFCSLWSSTGNNTLFQLYLKKWVIEWSYFSHVWKSVSWSQFLQWVIQTRASKIISCSWFHICDILSLSMACQQKENFKTNKFIYISLTSLSRVHK